jgi:hypothetical protein
VDLCRILVILHQLGHVDGRTRGTVSNYYSSAKHYYTVTRAHLCSVSPIWGAKKEMHPRITLMLLSIPSSPPRIKFLPTPEWVRDGFMRGCWSPQAYVTIAFLMGWILRVGEGCDTESIHLLTWSAVTFKIQNADSTWHVLPWSALRTTACDLVELLPASRKYQDSPRPMPGRVNTCHLSDPSHGTQVWTDMCMATLLQGWALDNHLDTMPASTRDIRPILAAPDTNIVLTRDQVSDALRTLARLRGEDPINIFPHCLRTTGISTMANSGAARDTDLYLRTVGHHSGRSSDPYVYPDEHSANAVTDILQHTR